jgi:hypothetical protein
MYIQGADSLEHLPIIMGDGLMQNATKGETDNNDQCCRGKEHTLYLLMKNTKYVYSNSNKYPAA